MDPKRRIVMNANRIVPVCLVASIALLAWVAPLSGATRTSATQSFDQCDIDIRPAGIPRSAQRNLVVDYASVINGLDVGLTMTYDVATFDLLDADGNSFGTLANTKRTLLSLRWADVTQDMMVTSSTGQSSFTLKSTGAYDANERDSSPSFEREASTQEFVRIRCRYKGRSTHFVLKIHPS
jgi:hypothetical protein